jgi:hypothetical protein
VFRVAHIGLDEEHRVGQRLYNSGFHLNGIGLSQSNSFQANLGAAAPEKMAILQGLSGGVNHCSELAQMQRNERAPNITLICVEAT